MGFRRRLVLAGLAALLLASLVLATLVGNIPLDWGQAMLAIVQSFPGLSGVGGPVEPLVRTITVDIRLPRVALALSVGAALGIGGAAMQGLLRNPLADPYIFGVSSGAAVGSAAAAAAGFAALGAMSYPAAAFVGALAATFLVYQVARVGGRLPVESMLLAGIAIGSLLAAVASFIVYLDARRHVNLIFWLLGSFHTASWEQVAVVAPLTFLVGGLLLLESRRLNALLFGDETALSLGVSTDRAKAVVLFFVALLTAGAVAFAGIIGFVGIIVPHTMRLLVGPDHRYLIPASGLFGGWLLVTCDLIARSAIPMSEMPVGILTAFLGAPFFVYLLRRSRRVGSWG